MAKRRRSSSRRRGSGSFSRPLSLLKPAAVGAAGALTLNAITNHAIPENLRGTLLAGNTAYLTRGAIAVLMGMYGPRLPFVGRYAGEMARGALVVVFADLLRQLAMQSNLPVNLSGMGYIGPARVVNLPRNGMAGMRGVHGMRMYVNR